MTDSQETKANGSNKTRTFKIEIPFEGFEKMFEMMSECGGDYARPGCCGPGTDKCQPESDEDTEQEIKIIIRKKE